jgi:acetolactate synthase-1/2/3 large subunit
MRVKFKNSWQASKTHNRKLGAPLLNKLGLSGAEALAKELIKNGIDLVFGIPGVHNLALFEALQRAGIRVVPATHEQGAAFMANGYGRATGKPGVFVTVPGPGLTNSLTPIAEAFVDSTPMLGIVTDVPRSKHKYQMHEIEQALLSKPVVKSVKVIENAADLPAALKDLLELTTQGEPGPCLLQIPGNLFWEKTGKVTAYTKHKQTPVISTQMEEVIARLQSAKRVGLFVGLGAADAADEVRALADWMKAPVATTGSGRGVMDEAHPLSLGFTWKTGPADSINRIFEACDLILAIGVKFSQNATHEYRLKIDCPLIHVDASEDVFDRNYKAEISVQMDAGEFMRALMQEKSRLGPRQDDEILKLIGTERKLCDADLKGDTYSEFFIGDDKFAPYDFFESLRALLPSNAILVTDSGYNERVTMRHWLTHTPRSFISPSNYACMGFAIPTAIGAAIAFPDRKVVAIVGDGGLVMSGLEMMSAVREKLNLTIIVLNNKGFGVIKRIQEDFFGQSVAVDVGAPDFELLAKSICMDYQPLTGGMPALEQSIRNTMPTLLEVKMQHREKDKAALRGRKLKNDVRQGLQKLIP